MKYILRYMTATIMKKTMDLVSIMNAVMAGND